MGSEDDKKIEKLSILLEEYRYRHEHIWKIIFQTTAAFVVLSVIPYVQIDVVRGLGLWIITMPLLALFIIIFVLVVVKNELDVFYKVKKKYRDIQKEIFEIEHGDDLLTFKNLVWFYYSGLILVGLINIYSIFIYWIPYIEKLPETKASLGS